MKVLRNTLLGTPLIILLFPTVFYTLVLDHDRFRLELDYRSIIHRVYYPYFRIYIFCLRHGFASAAQNAWSAVT